MAQPEFRWTQDSWGPEGDSGPGRASATRRDRLAWFGVVVVAVVAFEVTADPALSTALGCLKFGWEEVRISRWLKRADPDRRRGRILSRFYLAWGLWRVSLVASAMMFIIAVTYGVIEEQMNKVRGAGGPPPGFVSAFLLAMFGFILSSGVSSFAVASALRHRVRVWVGPEARWARDEDAWPPHRSTPRRRVTTNRTKLIVLSALITAFAVGLTVLGLFLLNAGPRLAESPALHFSLMMLFMIGVPILILFLLEWLGSRMIAPTPEACWADGPGSAA